MPILPDQLLYIGGRYVPSQGGQTFQVINPANGELLANVHSANSDDLDAAVEVLAGKIEFESGEEGREQDILDHLLRMATAETVRAHLHGIDLGPLVAALDGSSTVTTGHLVTAREFLEGLPSLNGSTLYDEVGKRLGADNDGQRAAAVELALEGLYLALRISKDSDDEATIYG